MHFLELFAHKKYEWSIQLLAILGVFGTRKPIHHTNWMAVVSPAHRPKSVCNRCAIEILVAFSCCNYQNNFCWCIWGFCHRTSQLSCIFSFSLIFASGLQASVNVHRRALLLVPQWQCIISFVFYTGGYKGYGLAMMVEIFCGMLSGSTYGPNVRDSSSTLTQQIW